MKKRLFIAFKRMMEKRLENKSKRMLANISQYVHDSSLPYFESIVDSAIDHQKYAISSCPDKTDLILAKENRELINKLIDRIPKYLITAPCRDEIVAELQGSCRVAHILSIWSRGMMELSALPSSSFTESIVHQITEFCKSIVEVAEGIYLYTDYNNHKIRNQLWEYWDKVLTRFQYGTYDEYGIIISLGDLNWDEIHYSMISCSFVTQDYAYFYRAKGSINDRSVGWYFRPSINDIIGMSPNDASSIASLCNHTADTFAKMFENRTLVDKEYWISSASPALQTMYSPGKMTSDLEYNEILLKGNVLPDGVFIFREEYSNLSSKKRRKAITVAADRGIPLIVCDTDKGRVEVLNPQELV